MQETALERGQRILLAQPFSAMMGTKMSSIEKEEVELILDLRGDHLQQHGFAHGGVVSYLADNALTFAGGTVLGNSVTLEFKVNYVRPATGDVLIARAKVVAGGRSQAVCTCDVFVRKDTEEKLCATAQGTIWKVEAAA